MTKVIGIVTVVIALAIAGITLTTDDSEVIRLSKPVEQTADSETFGSIQDETVRAVALGQIASDGKSYVGEPVRVEARISQVCQKKGCFFIAQDGDAVVRVSFKDYSFFVPTDISGKHVAFVGEVVAKEMTTEEAEHYAEDLGKSTPLLRPGVRYEIVATSVRVPSTAAR